MKVRNNLMKRSVQLLIAMTTALVPAVPLAAQAVPEIQFTATNALSGFPDNIHLGEVVGVARNSRGEIFVYTRTGNPTITLGTARAISHGGSRLFQFDASGRYQRELGIGVYGFLYGQQLRVDSRDNVWVVDQMSNQVMRFDTNGRVSMVLGRKPEAMTVPSSQAAAGGGAGAAAALAGRAGGAGAAAGGAGTDAPAAAAGRGGAAAAGRAGGAAGAGGAAAGAAPGGAAAGRGAGPGAEAAAAPAAGGRGAGAGSAGETFSRPADVAVDPAGNIFVADGLGNNARIAKYDPTGRYLMSWGSRGQGQGQFDRVTGIALDAQGNVYVADHGNRRIQVFDANGQYRREISGVGAPAAICISPAPRQFLFVSNSNPPDDIDVAGEIYKVELDGRVVGKFGRAGKPIGEFGTVNSIDCRNPDVLLVGEIGNWRVQQVTLR
jgi:hypothetical protein